MVDKDELAHWRRHPATVQLLERLAQQFPADQWQRIYSTEPQPLQQLGKCQGRQEVVQFVLQGQWAEE